MKLAVSEKRKAANRKNGMLGTRAYQKACNERRQKEIAAFLENPPLCLECGCVIAFARKHCTFCNTSCAGKYNNRHKDYTTFKPGPKKKPKVPKVRVKSTDLPEPYSSLKKCVCKQCGFVWFGRTAKRICAKHEHLYSHAGRAKYWFTFNVFDYPDLFDTSLITTIGFRSSDNPNGITRDHRVSVNESIRNGYNAYYIKHPMNCELMRFDENNKKKTKSSISYTELVRLADEYDLSKMSTNS